MEQALEILKISERLYAATMTDEQWPAALEAITDLFGGGHAIIQGFPGVDDDGAFIAAARVDNAVVGQTASSEAWRVVMRFERLVPAGISNRATLIDDRAFADSEIYNEIFRPMNGFHSLHVRQMQPHAPFALSVCWPRHATSFSYDKEALLRVLAPHAAMAVEIRNRLRSTQRRGDSLARMFDRLETGVIMTDAAAKPVLVNARAAAILDEQDGLVALCRSLAAATPAATARLRETIASAASDDALAGRRLRLERPSGRPALLLAVLPIWRLDACVAGVARPRVAIFIKEPDAPLAIDQGAVADAFGLTRRESEVATLLASGRSLSQIAAELGLGVGTVRNHLKRVFDKMGAHTQAAVVALARGFAEPRL